MSSRPISARQLQAAKQPPAKPAKEQSDPEDALIVAANLKNNLQALGYL
jgi:hypothetical protein